MPTPHPLAPARHSPHWQALCDPHLLGQAAPHLLDPATDAVQIITRVLTYGTLADLRHLFALYPLTLIADTVSHLPSSVQPLWRAYLAGRPRTTWEDALPPSLQDLLVQYGNVLCPPGFVLAGSAAGARWTRHREPVDLTFIIGRGFDATRQAQTLRTAVPALEITATDAHCLQATLHEIPLRYRYAAGVWVEEDPDSGTIPCASRATLIALACRDFVRCTTALTALEVYAWAQMASFDQVVDIAAHHTRGFRRLPFLHACATLAPHPPHPWPALRLPWTWPAIRSYLGEQALVYLHQRLTRPDAPLW